MKVSLIILAASLVVTISILWADTVPSRSATQPAQEATETQRETPAPKLSQGMWWITETHRVVQLLDKTVTADMPPAYTEAILTHKWEVMEQVKTSGKKCWVIDVSENNVLRRQRGTWPPPQIKVRLYIAIDNGALIRLEATVDDRDRDATAQIQQYQRNYSGKIAAINAWMPHEVPLDVPLLPTRWRDPLERKTTFNDNEGEVKQVVSPFTLLDAPAHRAMVVTLQHDTHGVRSMLWDDECPWWREWRCVHKDGSISGLWYAKTIDWKGKGDAKNASGTATKASDHP